ncbi:MAG TPA: endonuclease/exonuclease/phosphatase family protein [Gemmatimonadales bacterium]|nr:endonuclease/exonuclease/phosphatase family protein [Gemmatimonadales bacterium]
MRLRPFVLSLLLPTLGACAHGMNYTDPAGPRFSGSPPEGAMPASAMAAEPARIAERPGRIRVASFNIAWARKTDEAIELIQAEPALAGADLFMLQEMDEASAAKVAKALGMHYVYYPATLHPKSDRNFGNALLSRWPIESDSKLILPHTSWQLRTQRIAVLGTVRIGGERVTVATAHFGTIVEIFPWGQRDQARALLEAVKAQNNVIVAGDFNTGGLGELFEAEGFTWPTRGIGDTHRFWSFDHVYARGFVPIGRGMVKEVGDISDHKPIWADLAWAPQVASAGTTSMAAAR